ncbi:MAG: TonB-dependent receptor [Candidatus Omnitrophota bacterium]
MSIGILRFVSATMIFLGVIFFSAEIKAENIEDIELEKIVVTARRSEAFSSEIAENIEIFTEADISNIPSNNLSEALDYIGGIDIDRRSGFGRATSISIQGSDSRQVRIMIDGIPLNTQSSGQVDLTKFPIENVKRIEVIKGASSSMWGSSLGGVVNVITKDTGTALSPGGNITTSFAEFRTQKESIELSGGCGDLGYYSLTTYMESGGKGLKDDVLEKKTFNKFSYDLREMGKLALSFGYTGSDVNSGEYPGEWFESKPFTARYGKVGWEGNLNDIGLKAELKHSRQIITTHTYDYITDEVPSSSVWYRDLLYQLSIVSSLKPRDKDLLVIGGDFDWDMIKSNHLAEAKSLNLKAPYINYTFKEERWDMNLGARYDDNSEYGKEISPSLGIVYRLEDIANTTVKATASRAFNAPPLLWKYYERVALGVTADNPGIGPEEAMVYGISLESGPFSGLSAKLSLYRSDIDNAIGNSQNENGDWIKKNFEKYRRQGVELELKAKLSEGLSLLGGGAFNDIEDRSTKKTVEGGGKARQSFDIGLDYFNKKGYKLSLRGYYDYWNEPASSEPNDRKMIFDLKLSREFNKYFSMFLNIYNITNSKYWRDFYFPMPERYLEGGISLSW